MGRQEIEPSKRQLLDAESRQKLLDLETGEQKGLNAHAQVKLYVAEGNWIWYASAFDGVDALFGLVVGDNVELGYFSLTELEEFQGPKDSLVQRDRDFQPTLLQELRIMHKEEKLNKG